MLQTGITDGASEANANGWCVIHFPGVKMVQHSVETLTDRFLLIYHYGIASGFGVAGGRAVGESDQTRNESSTDVRI